MKITPDEAKELADSSKCRPEPTMGNRRRQRGLTILSDGQFIRLPHGAPSLNRRAHLSALLLVLMPSAFNAAPVDARPPTLRIDGRPHPQPKPRPEPRPTPTPEPRPTPTPVPPPSDPQPPQPPVQPATDSSREREERDQSQRDEEARRRRERERRERERREREEREDRERQQHDWDYQNARNNEADLQRQRDTERQQELQRQHDLDLELERERTHQRELELEREREHTRQLEAQRQSERRERERLAEQRVEAARLQTERFEVERQETARMEAARFAADQQQETARLQAERARQVTLRASRRAFVFGPSRARKLYLRSGSNTSHLILTWRGEMSHPALSPDGTRIAFAGRTTNNWDVYLINADGSGLKRLTNSTARDFNPSWSEDNRSVFFQSNRNGGLQTFALDARGGNLRRVAVMGVPLLK